MWKLPLLCFFLFSVHIASSQDERKPDLLLTDTMLYYRSFLTSQWLFMEGDDPQMAAMNYDDSQWNYRRTTLSLVENDTGTHFKGIGWFRLHFISDSTTSGVPLALSLTQYGASEIYLDGTLLTTFGKIDGPDSSEYFDPQELPFIFHIQDTGKHVMAIRYANYDAEKNYRKYLQSTSGFRMMIGTAFHFITSKDQRTAVVTLVLMFLSGIFSALSLIHMFMFLYYRKLKSNLFFSIFMMALAMIFTILFIMYTSNSPALVLQSGSLLQPLYVLACIALSGFTNTLFDKKKTRFWILVGLGILALISRFFAWEVYTIITTGLVISVAIEAIITIVIAMYRKIKGAYIIGTGILFTTLFVLTIFIVGVVQSGNFDLNDSTIGGQLLLLFLALAILSIPFSMSVYLAWNFSSINKNLALQLDQVQVLSKKTIEQEREKQRYLENRKVELEQEVWERTTELRAEKKKSDDLLLNILPSEVAEELKQKGSADAQLVEDVTILFTDFKGFTQLSEKLTPKELIGEINACFSAFDHIMQKHGIEKIKTIGDSYMAAGGLPVPNKTHAMDVVSAALEIREYMQAHRKQKEAAGQLFFEIRIGIHSGPVVAGIAGVKKFAYDIWGDAVNIASRMESSGEIGKINISETTYQKVKDQFQFTSRGKIQAKGKGEMEMYFVNEMM